MDDDRTTRGGRPSPDALQQTAQQDARGRLKIFVGAAPGVGKTYEMLTAARAHLQECTDVVVGIVETHGHQETEALLDGLEVIPRQNADYKGRVLEDMGLNALLARRPQLALVDELAHTNAPGSRHPKRYLDVEGCPVSFDGVGTNHSRPPAIISCTYDISHMTGPAFRRHRQRPYLRLNMSTGAGSMFQHAKSHVLACCVAMLTLGLTMLSASATPTTSPAGTWLTANGHGVVAIAQCGDALCGRIVGIDRQPTEPMPTDVDGHSQCGLTIITNERPAEDGTWLGKITDPRNGNLYQAKLWVDEDGDLHLRGFIGIPLLGSTQIWRKYTGHLTAECGLA